MGLEEGEIRSVWSKGMVDSGNHGSVEDPSR